MKHKITIDPGPCTALVQCSCGWRDITPGRSSAWLSAARHLKRDHGDIQAGYNARHNAYLVDRRAAVSTKRTRHDLQL